MEKKAEFYVYMFTSIIVITASIVCMTIAFRMGGLAGILAGIIMAAVACANFIWIIVPLIAAIVGHNEKKYEKANDDIDSCLEEIVEDSYNLFRK